MLRINNSGTFLLSGPMKRSCVTNMKVRMGQWAEEKAVLKTETEQNKNKEGGRKEMR
jgi:hypothetical protein